ncbi:phytochrome-like protein [Ceraceosorus bombacis]|uniref:Phytochrome-like protein n=1 Tax=Ceraceosorus bombacis TaxID=401625 RepID=A0A0P1BR65_9BASI|nr:phytochrome-like protein [Ceraceosorus bombacis]
MVPSSVASDKNAAGESPAPLSPRYVGPSSSSTQESGGFIYPIRSAVSVRPPAASAQGSQAMSPQSSREGGHTHSHSIESLTSGKRPASSHSRGASLTRALSKSSVGSAAAPPTPSSKGDPEASASYARVDAAADSSVGEYLDLDSVDEEASEAQEARHSDVGYAELDPLDEDARKLARREALAEAAEKDRLESMTQTRFTHIATPDGHMIVTGRQKELTRCEEEPIHIPGAVQSFGCMIVVREDEEGNLVVRQASENTGDILGLAPAFLFKTASFLDCLEDDEADRLWDTIEALDQTEQELTESGPVVIQLSGWGQPGPGTGRARARRHWECWCAVHQPKLNATPQGRRPLTILEFELINDAHNPLYHPTEPPAVPVDEHNCELRQKAQVSVLGQGTQSSASGGASASGTAVQQTTGLDAKESLSGQLARLSIQAGASPGSGTEGASTRSTSPRPSLGTSSKSDDTARPSNSSSVTLSARGLGGLEGEPYEPSHEQWLESTQSTSRPLRSLTRTQDKSGEGNGRRRPRPKKATAGGGPGLGSGRRDSGSQMLDMFGILSQVNEQLSAESELNSFLKVAVSLVREVTGFGRVMIYQFDEAWNGQVVCELVDWSETHDLYRGLHFPASDIPKQARDLYMINKVRLLYDRDQPSARMVCREQEDLHTPVDMTHAVLRAMSPIHIKYLANMGVRASMSISITAFDQLWGLIALHTYGEYGKRVSFPERQLSRLIGASISRNIERLSYTRRLGARKLINTLPTDQNPSGYIISNAEDLLKLFDADFGVIAIGSEAKILGPLSASQEVLGCTEYLRIKKFQRVVVSQDVSADFPDMVLPRGLEVIAGLLLVPLSNSGVDFIAFLRKAQNRQVNWAGRPFKQGQEGSAALEPRKSFKIWSETVTGTCRAWKDEELETANVLCLVYGKFISVWRQREQAMQYNQLNRLLLSNASHEVRTPLNHIINYLEMALDGNLDVDTRDHLSKSHMASKSLLFVINDLLDLTRQEHGNRLFLQEPFDLASTIREAVEMHEWEAKRREIDFTVTTQPETLMVLGDKNRIRSIVTNTVTNSVKHTTKGQIVVEMRQRDSLELSELPEDCDIEVELTVSDTGSGIPRAKLESIFREFEQVESVIADPSAPSDVKAETVESEGVSGSSDELELAAARDVEKSKQSGGVLGLGLAVVARVVRNLGGQLRVDSTVDEGSRFTYLIPFRSAERGEAARGGAQQVRRRSASLQGSEASGSGQSEINSLVEALNAPHLDASDAGSSAIGSGGQRRSVEMTRTQSTSSSEQARPPQAITLRPVHDTGVHISGSKVPLRSVRVDPHELDGQSSDSGLRGTGALPQAQSPSGPTAEGRNDRGVEARDYVGTKNEPHASQSAATKASISSDSQEGESARIAASKGASGRRLAAANRGRSSAAAQPNPKVPPCRALVVEDDPINRAILSKRLGRDGHSVSSAVNGEEGVRAFEKDGDAIDVVLMDLQMPICNGQEACRRIRALEAQRKEASLMEGRPAVHILNGRIPILAVSATLTHDMHDEIVDLGFDGFILKPIDFARLYALLNGLKNTEQRAAERWSPSKNWEKGGWLSAAPERS